MATTTANTGNGSTFLTSEFSGVVQSIPWYVWTSVLAVTCACVGLHWDISWHRSIGRDTFWTPAHLAIQFCGVLAGISCGAMILHTTLAKAARLRESSVRVLGFYGPLGAFISVWGGLVMIFSAPFDNWWHAAYGLDVKIVSPPHTLLALGIFGVAFGGLMLTLAAMNRASGALRGRLEALYLYIMAMIFVLMQMFIMEYLRLTLKHTSAPYIVLAMASPLLLANAAFVVERRFVATAVAAIYTFFILALTTVLPLFHAEPKLGPVFQHITYFVPPPFPPMVIIPAFALDLLWLKAKHWNVWLVSVCSGLIFVAFMLAADWNTATFILQSKIGQARFFHLGYIDFATPTLTDSFYGRHQFITQPLRQFWIGIGEAAIISVVSVRIGIARALWMKKVRR